MVEHIALDTRLYPFGGISTVSAPATTAATPSAPTTSTTQSDPAKAERDRLVAEVESERKKRHELEAQLAATKVATEYAQDTTKAGWFYADDGSQGNLDKTAVVYVTAVRAAPPSGNVPVPASLALLGLGLVGLGAARRKQA